jgi:hypothetical protein
MRPQSDPSGFRADPRLTLVGCPRCEMRVLVVLGTAAWCATCPSLPVLTTVTTWPNAWAKRMAT